METAYHPAHAVSIIYGSMLTHSDMDASACSINLGINSASRLVLDSAEYIVNNAKHVSISQEGVENVVKFVIDELQKDRAKDAWELKPHGLNNEELLEWIFLLDTLNFCFWADTKSDLFTVHYKGKEWTGYRSMCAALCIALEEKDLPVYKPSFYGSLTLPELQDIFTSSNGAQIPLLEERLSNLHESSQVLQKVFNGSVVEMVRQSEKSAQKLVRLLVENFAHFCDASTYKDRRVLFLKRAQIFVAHVWFRFNGKGYGEFTDINTITMFADYKVPQLLVFLDVLNYSDSLMETLQKGIHVDKDSQYEAEIRGSSIWAVEMICRLVKESLKSVYQSATAVSPDDVCPCLIDFVLWNYAATHYNELSTVPIHKTKTIFY